MNCNLNIYQGFLCFPFFLRSQALLVTERTELKMWHLLTSNENDFYMCLPRGNMNMKIENGSTNCYVPAALLNNNNNIGSKSVTAMATSAVAAAAVDATTTVKYNEKQFKEEVVVAMGEQQKFTNQRLHVNLYKASVCDKIVQHWQQRQQQHSDNDHQGTTNSNNEKQQQQQQQNQLKLYLHDGSSTTSSSSSSSICGIANAKDADQNEQVGKGKSDTYFR